MHTHKHTHLPLLSGFGKPQLSLFATRVPTIRCVILKQMQHWSLNGCVKTFLWVCVLTHPIVFVHIYPKLLNAFSLELDCCRIFMAVTDI